MNNLQRGVIDIVYSALTGEKITLSKNFDFSEGVKVAKKHKIEVMFYYGALNCGFAQDEPLMQELFMLVCGNIAISERQLYAVKELFTAFDEHKIAYLPLKGTVLKSMYPKFEMRSMSDADILIKTEQYGTIKPIMQGLGYTEITESNHELIWKKQNIHIELHKRLIPSYNKDYYAYYGDGWRLAKVQDGTRYSMTDEDQMIYLFTHFAKHYRDAGIGIKHIIDLWVYRKKKPALDEAYIKKELTALQLYDFYVNIINTLSGWFEDRESDEKTDFISEIIFNSGVYGTHESDVLSDAYKQVKSGEKAKNIRIINFFKTAFLPYSNMSQKYHILKKAPFLLPVMWIIRCFEIVFCKSDKIKAQVNDFKNTTADRITEYGQALNFVGLDFNFKE